MSKTKKPTTKKRPKCDRCKKNDADQAFGAEKFCNDCIRNVFGAYTPDMLMPKAR